MVREVLTRGSVPFSVAQNKSRSISRIDGRVIYIRRWVHARCKEMFLAPGFLDSLYIKSIKDVFQVDQRPLLNFDIRFDDDHPIGKRPYYTRRSVREVEQAIRQKMCGEGPNPNKREMRFIVTLVLGVLPEEIKGEGVSNRIVNVGEEPQIMILPDEEVERVLEERLLTIDYPNFEGLKKLLY